MNITTLTHWAATHSPGSYIGAAVAGLAVLLLSRSAIRSLRRHDLADTLTVLIALATTVYAGSGNWKFLGSAMHYGTDLKAVLVSALEGAVVVEGLRSRKNIAANGKAGADGVGLWVLAGLSSLLASSASGSFPEALGRLAIPLTAAWLWERLLAPERQARKNLRPPAQIKWRITPERILVWLRVADAIDMDVSQVDAGRRVARFLRKTDRERNGRRWPFTAKASADRERLRMFRDALMRYGDPTDVYGTLAKTGYAQALERMGLAARVSHEGESEDGGHGGLRVSQQRDLITPGDSVFADVIASLPPGARVESANGRKRASAASQKPRRRESVTARVSVDMDRATQVYRASVEAGEPLSSRDLAALTKVSQSTASRAIRAASDG